MRYSHIFATAAYISSASLVPAAPSHVRYVSGTTCATAGITPCAPAPQAPSGNHRNLDDSAVSAGKTTEPALTARSLDGHSLQPAERFPDPLLSLRRSGTPEPVQRVFPTFTPPSQNELDQQQRPDPPQQPRKPQGSSLRYTKNGGGPYLPWSETRFPTGKDEDLVTIGSANKKADSTVPFSDDRNDDKGSRKPTHQRSRHSDSLV